MKDQNVVTPKYADAGRKQRVEFFAPLGELTWHEHCLASDWRYEPFADDRASTRDSCCLPDCKTNGIPTEIKMWTGWKSGEFPKNLPVQIPANSLAFRDQFEAGRFVMINMDGTHAVIVSFDIDPIRMVETNSHSHASGKMFSAQYELSQCRQIELKKIQKKLN